MHGVKHTPGPWRHDGQGDITGVEIDPDDGCAVEWDICSVYLRTAHGRHEANARLIAAAPDLFSACQAFVAYDNNDATDGVAMMVAYNNTLRSARAAIADAEGETT